MTSVLWYCTSQGIRHLRDVSTVPVAPEHACKGLPKSDPRTFKQASAERERSGPLFLTIVSVFLVHYPYTAL